MCLIGEHSQNEMFSKTKLLELALLKPTGWKMPHTAGIWRYGHSSFNGGITGLSKQQFVRTLHIQIC